MILKPESIFRYLPEEIEKRQFLILDSIRFSLEIIDNNWISLNNELEKLSNQDSKYVKDLPKLYINAWSIIDNVQRLIKLHSQLNIKSQEKLMDSIKYIKHFRHTFQHLDYRIDQALIDSNIPIYGILTWNYSNPKTGKVEVIITSSGVARYDLEFRYKVTDFNKSNSINNIKFDTVVRKNKDVFERAELDLSNLISSLKEIINLLEKDLEGIFNDLKLERLDWIRRKDILLRLK